MNDAELDIGLREKPLDDGEESREIVLDKDQDLTKAALDKIAENRFPVFEAFATEASEASQNTLLALSGESDDEVDAGGPEAVTVTEFDIFCVDEKG